MQHKDVTVMQRIPHLERVNCVSISFLDGFIYLFRRHSVMIHAIIEFDIFQEMHTFAGYEEVTLGEDSFNLRVGFTECAKNTS